MMSLSYAKPISILLSIALGVSALGATCVANAAEPTEYATVSAEMSVAS